MLGILSYELMLFALTLLALYAYLKLSHTYHWFDCPDEGRKLHKQVKPTSAGLVFLLPIIIVMLWLPVTIPINAYLVVVIMIMLMFMGGVDDFKPISAKLKAIVFFILSSYFIYSVFYDENVSYLLLAFYVVSLVWWLNLFNFMDGSDGMAIFQAIIPMLGYSYLYLNFDMSSALILPYFIMILLSFIAFLLFNFPKAKMFMGDSGSLSVAFLLAVFALYGISNNIFGEILVVSFHLVFIVDTTLTLFTRIKYKHSISQAHNLHLYQQLINRGLSHAKVTVIYALATMLLVIISLYSHYSNHSIFVKIVILLSEIIVLSFIWYNLQNKTKFKQFDQ